jgi:tetratricopeptide (TPR) repeat protein
LVKKHGGREMAVCIKCGAELEPGKKFCAACGRKIGKKTISAMENAKYDKDIADYTRAIELKQDNDRSWYLRGLAYYFKDDYAAAIVDLSKAVELDPNNAQYEENLEVIKQEASAAAGMRIIMRPSSRKIKVRWFNNTKKIYHEAVKQIGRMLEYVPGTLRSRIVEATDIHTKQQRSMMYGKEDF